MPSKKQQKEVIYPIEHWSHSSMMDFLSNPLIFKKKWILKIPDEDRSVATMVGSACHKALEVIFGGNPEVETPEKFSDAIHLGIEYGLDWLDRQPDTIINYGKTGSREQMLQKYRKAIQWYIDEMPKWDVVACEATMKEFLRGDDGTAFGLPMKGRADLIVRKENKRLRIIDHKFSSRYTDPDEENAVKILQSMFLYHLVKEKFGEAPEDIVFRECKTSENKDGTVQTKEWGIVYEQVPHYFTIFFRLFDDCTRAIAREDVMFLPNFRDMFSGNESFMLYQQNLLGVDMSDVIVDHSTHHVRYMPKETTFAESKLESVDAQALLPEERVRIKLGEFGVPVKAGEVHYGPSVTLYTFTPSRGVPVSRIEKHKADIALALRAESVRIIAPIPGTDKIGIEVPREDRDVIEFDDSLIKEGSFEIPIGIDLYGNIIRKDVRVMPHLLVAGATGAGKSVFINSVIHTLSKQLNPNQMKMILIDPKQVELAHWDNDPHLADEIIYSVKKSVEVLDDLVNMMESRYKTLRKAGVRSIESFSGDMPYFLVVIDEFADLMMSKEKIKKLDLITGRAVDEIVSGSEIETSIVRLAQKGRAAGIHLVVGTQRPSVDVITGIIKANIPTRVAFMTASQVDSKVILDIKGAEELLGRGDMLFLDPSSKGLQRLQGYFL